VLIWWNELDGLILWVVTFAVNASYSSFLVTCRFIGFYSHLIMSEIASMSDSLPHEGDFLPSPDEFACIRLSEHKPFRFVRNALVAGNFDVASSLCVLESPIHSTNLVEIDVESGGEGASDIMEQGSRKFGGKSLFLLTKPANRFSGWTILCKQ
jgi:hypothetical protein